MVVYELSLFFVSALLINLFDGICFGCKQFFSNINETIIHLKSGVGFFVFTLVLATHTDY